MLMVADTIYTFRTCLPGRSNLTYDMLTVQEADDEFSTAGAPQVIRQTLHPNPGIGQSTQLGACSVGDAVAMQAVGRVCPVTIGQDSMS